MGHYRSNLRDLEFNLFEVFGVEELLGGDGYPDLDADTVRQILAEVDRSAREELADAFTEGDRQPPVFDPASHSAPLPPAFVKAYRAFLDAGFWRLGDLAPELGGTPAPRMLWRAIGELVMGANPAVWIYASGPPLANVLWHEGTAEQKAWARIFVDREWGSTMALTEADAGSDVGAGRAVATPQPDGSWHVEGVKRFITSGEHDLTENIVHYVLARPVGVAGAGGPGTKGLSLFVVPKFHFDPATGELGARNGVYATNVEQKMGLKVSNTCELTFGQHGVPAVGWLVGERHDGIRQMFRIIEYARMMVGTKAIATLSTGYLNALAYARERVQGADLTRMADKTAPRVRIVAHPDVRRSLMLQKAYAEGLRALLVYTGRWQDRMALGPDRELAARVNDLLLPLVKGVGSERAYELLGHESLQTFGGSGYLADYPLEQYVRDAKIDTLYEGTTAIQSLDLVFRKIAKDQGVALMTVAAEIGEFVGAEGDDDAFAAERVALGRAVTDVQGVLGTMLEWLTAAQGGEPRQLYLIGLHSRRLLLALGDLFVGWLLLTQAEVAARALDRADLTDGDRAFYTGKVAVARFFAREVLPRLTADRKIVQSARPDLMDVPEEAF
ncbi:acyl-CoA dehydrogenase [Micromonospora sp. WMMD882]|uniref:acyl-CoA dehydrogenase n=1 Tax=Micromonospora sp. WMMD882 TaxID=3015151 RepID=UPI00248AA6C6|nr:acyl-CoA dehydrogenase [Micromonospora sp. WMMD882]WBB81386.1 acyl-CoA dehydrogenase [Micromonospora sp. WMMD882]